MKAFVCDYSASAVSTYLRYFCVIKPMFWHICVHVKLGEIGQLITDWFLVGVCLAPVVMLSFKVQL